MGMIFYFPGYCLSPSEYSHCHPKDEDQNFSNDKIFAKAASSGIRIAEAAIVEATVVIIVTGVVRVTVIKIIKT
jgi:hypothetical protein